MVAHPNIFDDSARCRVRAHARRLDAASRRWRLPGFVAQLLLAYDLMIVIAMLYDQARRGRILADPI